MKNIIFLFLYLLASNTSAQVLPPSALKTGIGISHHGKEKVNTPTLFVGFSKDFFSRTQIDFSAAWALPITYNSLTETGEVQSVRMNLAMIYNILADRKQQFGIGAGFSAGFFDSSITQVLNGIYIEETALIPGFVLIANYDFILPSYWFFGARASTFRYDIDRSGWMIAFTAGLKF